MTETAEPMSGPVRGTAQHLRTILIACFAPGLVLLAIVVPFLRFHQYDLLLPESLMLVGLAAALGLLVGAISCFRLATLGPALTAVVLCVYIFYRPEVTLRAVGAANLLGEWIGNPGAALGGMGVLLFLAMCTVCWLFERHLATVVAAIFGTIVLTSVVLPTTIGGEAVEHGALPQKLNDLPPVIHIVLDEHIGLAGMPPEIEESATAIQSIEKTYKDFALYSHAYSRFAETQNSLGSLMNHERGKDVLELLDKQEYGHKLRDSAWFDLLKAKGYAIKVYQTPFLDMCVDSHSVDACYTYPMHSPNAVQRSPLSAGARLRVLLGELHVWRSTPLPVPVAAREAFDRFQSDLAQAPRGVAYFVHLLMPHYDYLYRSDCSLADPAQWETQPGHQASTAGRAERLVAYGLYMGQLLCTHRIMGAFLDSLRQLGIYQDATIIVHGDHGSRLGEQPSDAPADLMSNRDLLDYFTTFLAIKTPTTEPGLREEPTLVQHIFAKQFLGDETGPTDASGQVLLREQPDVFASRVLHWPQGSATAFSQGADGHSSAQLRRSIDEKDQAIARP